MVLQQDTPAVQIHPKTKQPIRECTLEKGTEYFPVRTPLKELVFGTLIIVDGLLYKVDPITY